MDRFQPSVTSTTVIGGVGPDAIHIGAHYDGTIGIHVSGRGVYASLFGTLDDMVAVNTKLGLGLAKIAAANIPDPAVERLGATP